MCTSFKLLHDWCEVATNRLLRAAAAGYQSKRRWLNQLQGLGGPEEAVLFHQNAPLRISRPPRDGVGHLGHSADLLHSGDDIRAQIDDQTYPKKWKLTLFGSLDGM